MNKENQKPDKRTRTNAGLTNDQLKEAAKKAADRLLETLAKKYPDAHTRPKK